MTHCQTDNVFVETFQPVPNVDKVFWHIPMGANFHESFYETILLHQRFSETII